MDGSLFLNTDQRAAHTGGGLLSDTISAEPALSSSWTTPSTDKDVITTVNGRKIYETSDVTRAIDRSDDGAEFTIEVMRDKKPQTLKGKLETVRPRGRGVATMF